LKGIPEEGHGTENTAEKVSELLEYLGFEIEAADIERANRVGGRDHDGPRAIVMELNSERLKHAILGEAAVKLRHTPYSILGERFRLSKARFKDHPSDIYSPPNLMFVDKIQIKLLNYLEN
jgi:hypothetical protein